MGVLENAQAEFPKYADAIAAFCVFVGDVLEVEPNGRPDEVAVYLFGHPEHPRIGEISAVWNRSEGGSAGVSWMRPDAAEHGNVLLCAEDFLLNHGDHGDVQVDGRTNDVIIDTENEARWRLAFALGRKDAEIEPFLIDRSDALAGGPVP